MLELDVVTEAVEEAALPVEELDVFVVDAMRFEAVLLPHCTF